MREKLKSGSDNSYQHISTIRDHLEHFCPYGVLPPQPSGDDEVALRLVRRKIFPEVAGSPQPRNLDPRSDAMGDILDQRCNAIATGVCELATYAIRETFQEKPKPPIKGTRKRRSLMPRSSASETEVTVRRRGYPIPPIPGGH